jgi:hypothetical protein
VKASLGESKRFANVALDDSGITEFAELAFSGKLHTWGRSNSQMDQRAGVALAQKMNLSIPNTWDGRALYGLLGTLERHGMAKTDLRHFAEQRLEEITPEKRPDPVFKSQTQEIREDNRAALKELAVSESTSRVIRTIAKEQLQAKRKRRYRRS